MNSFISTAYAYTDDIEEARKFQADINKALKEMKEQDLPYTYYKKIYLDNTTECYFYDLKSLKEFDN